MKKKVIAIVLMVVLVAGLAYVSCKPCNYSNNDLNQIKAIIMQEKEASPLERMAYDFNDDGEITSVDYVICKKIIKGA